MRDIDPDRGVEQHTGKMIGAARPGRAVLHLRLVGLRVGDELLKIVGREILARDQDKRLIRHQSHRREVGRRVIEWSLVKRLVLGVGPDIAEHELIAVWCCFCHAVGARHAAGAADVFDDDGLMKLAAQPISDDARDGVG